MCVFAQKTSGAKRILGTQSRLAEAEGAALAAMEILKRITAYRHNDRRQRSIGMLVGTKTLNGYKLRGVDGDIGTVKDFYFDDHHWTVRYLVVDTGDWLTNRLVLVSPHALTKVDKEQKVIVVNLTKKRIEDSPSWNTDKPVSRQFEKDYYGYYGWPAYWDGPFMWGPFYSPQPARDEKEQVNSGGKPWDSSLRSASAVRGYNIHAEDGEIGHIDDFVLDDRTWTIRYMIVDTRNWWPGKKVLVSTRWITRVSWEEMKIHVDLIRDTVKRSPEFTKESLLNRDYETALHGHYQRDGYWQDVSDKIAFAAARNEPAR
jgi:sporulation protein YlmC with PRC-barrel domain